MKLFGPLIFVAAAAAACAPDARPGTSSDAGLDGNVSGGSGGATPGVGGKGGSSGKGGSGGKAGMGGSVGSGGSAPSGGSGGGGQAGGGMTGTGGNMGGNMAGTGGMMPPPPPGPVARPTGPALFPGNAATVSTIVAGDPSPGYFYAISPSGITPNAAAEALAAGQTGLPAGITHAYKVTSATTTRSALIIFGFNFRADDGKKWRWIDATAFAGLSFWVRSANAHGLTVTLVDATNVTATDERVGTCMKTTMAECPGVPGRQVNVGTTWTQIKLRWTDFLHEPMDVQGPVNVAQIGRIDLLYVVQEMMMHELLITDVRLATAAEFM